MKVLFLTDNFPPEVNAPATRTFEHCREWVKKGVDVTVITCAPNFPEGKVFKGYKNKIYTKEVVDGINVIRVWTYISANQGFLKRIVDFISFMISSFVAGLFIKTDVIVATSPQFFTAVSGRWLSFWKRTKWVMEVRDLWPESIKAVGAMKGGLVIKFFEFLEKRMYESASKIIVVTDSFKCQLINRGIDENKLVVVKNGINTSLFKPQPKDNKSVEKLGLQGKFVIAYIGTHGMAHALDFILKSAKQVKNKEFHFLLIGAGAKKEELVALKESLQLENVTMIGMMSKKEIVDYISISDVSLVNLKKSDTFKHVIPSKIFENVAMYKPILLGVEGESKEMIEQYGVGEVFDPENESSYFSALNRIYERPKGYYNIGFEKMISDFDRRKLAEDMLEKIKQCV